MIIQISSQKGGSGKSTLATNISTALAHAGKDVLLVDADRQITASRWWAERQRSHADLPKINCVQKDDDISTSLVDLNNRYEMVVVDTSGHDSNEMRSAMVVCDVLIIPFRPSSPDLDTLFAMNELIKRSRFINPAMRIYACINSAPTNSKSIDVDYAASAIDQYVLIQRLNTVLFDRRIYRDAMPEGMGVIEMSGRSDSDNHAKHEINSLINEVFDV